MDLTQARNEINRVDTQLKALLKEYMEHSAASAARFSPRAHQEQRNKGRRVCKTPRPFRLQKRLCVLEKFPVPQPRRRYPRTEMLLCPNRREGSKDASEDIVAHQVLKTLTAYDEPVFPFAHHNDGRLRHAVVVGRH